MKWSVIIPTLWKSPRIKKLLEQLNQTDLVEEIIVIDNSPAERPSDLNSGKVRFLTKGGNIFVNPAWNWGIQEASCKHIVLCNDDINFDPSLFGFFNQINFENTIYGSARSNFNKSDVRAEFSFESGHYIGDGWGCLLFFEKSFFKNIPEDLLVWCGDDWLVHTFNKICHFHWPIYTEMSTTSSLPRISTIASEDKARLKRHLRAVDHLRIKFLHKDNGGRFDQIILVKEILRQGTRGLINRLKTVMR